MTIYNTWLPSNTFYDFNTGVTTALEYKAVTTSQNVLCKTFTIPDNKSGFGFTFDQINPASNMTKPPKVFYTSTSDMKFILKDAGGWLWAADCPKQDSLAERGWAWSQFKLHTVQENTGDSPTEPTAGVILGFQWIGAEGVFGDNNNTPQSISIGYVSANSPKYATSGDIRRVTITDTSDESHVLKIGDVALVNGSRREIKYLGALPFGIQLNGPKNNLAVLPYRGPIIAGYQSATPWVLQGDNISLGAMLDFMLESQNQFNQRSPDKIIGPFMHAYLPAVWDCEQNGTLDTWVWEGPDGNPTWDGWQYRAIDAMSRSWYLGTTLTTITQDNLTKFTTIVTQFLDWLYLWLMDNPTLEGVPDDWLPTGWVDGQIMTPDMCLNPKFSKTSGHDNALVLKAAVNAANAGYDQDKAKYIIHRTITALLTIQITDASGTNEMRGSFTLNPTGYEVYGFEQGEILEAISLAKQYPSLLSQK